MHKFENKFEEEKIPPFSEMKEQQVKMMREAGCDIEMFT